jgi:murein tripeptide amidase MpaA
MRTRFFALLTSLLLLITVLPVAASAQTPGGPWLTPEQNVSLERLSTYDELVKSLHRIERSSQGTIELEVIGQSNEGRDIYMAKAGSGDTTVMYITQQHGNEPLPTEAALNLLQHLGSSNSPEVRRMLSELTILVVVRANPDGSERYWRQNYDPDASGPFHASGRGFDMNRYHDPALAPEDNPVPESAAIRRAHDRYSPDIVVDYHHQGSYVDEDGRQISMSVFWPNNPDVESDVIDCSRQVAVTHADAVQDKGHANVSLYPGGTIAGIARNAFGLLGSCSVLVEFRGGIGQKSSGYLIRQAYDGMYATLAAAADGSLWTIDPARGDDIPPRGSFLPNPRNEE